MRGFKKFGWVAVAASAVLLATAAPAAGQASTPPLDYIAQRDKLSQPDFPVTITEVVRLSMADGEEIYLEITRPDPAEHPEVGPVPVILEASPYHGTIATRIGDRIFPDPKDEQGNNVGLTGYFAPRGYAVAMMDLRGTGRSQGCLDHIGPNDASDMKEVIKWLAEQEWSNGRVGMTGHSYVGSTPNAAAAMRPNGLVTIAPSAGLASMYDHQFNKGVPWLLQWAGPMFAYEALAMERDHPPGTPAVFSDQTGDNWEEHGPNPQYGCGWRNSSLTAGSGQVTGQYEAWHAERDWREGAADADIPIFMIHGTNDNAARIPAAEWFFGDRGMRDGDKVWIGRWNHGSGSLSSCADARGRQVSHPNCRFSQWQYALHAWFDHHLQQRTWIDEAGVEHPIDTGPAVEAFLNGRNPLGDQAVLYPGAVGQRVFTADAWREYPMIELWPDATDMSLRFGEPQDEGSATFGPTANAVVVHLIGEARIVRFISDPVAEDTLFVGLPRLTVHASVTNSQIAHITASLFREAPGGAREAMSHCAVNALVRDDVETLSPVVPGEEMPMGMQCFTMAHWVPQGQRLVLEFSPRTPHHASYGADAQVTVHTGPGKTNTLLPSVPEFTLHNDVSLEE